MGSNPTAHPKVYSSSHSPNGTVKRTARQMGTLTGCHTVEFDSCNNL